MAKKRLKSTEDIRRFLANLILKTENKEFDPLLAGKLGYLSSILLKAIEGGDLEKRVEALERKLAKQGGQIDAP